MNNANRTTEVLTAARAELERVWNSLADKAIHLHQLRDEGGLTPQLEGILLAYDSQIAWLDDEMKELDKELAND